MTDPAFKGAGAVTIGSGAPLTATGVPVVAGDVSLLFVAGSSSSVSTPTGWTACSGNDPSGPSLSVFWQRATGSGTPTATVTDGSGTRALVIESFTGCATSGDPTEAGATQQNARSTVMAIPTITTLGDGRLVVLAGTPSADTTISAISNDGILIDLATRIEVDQTVSSQGIVIADGVLSAEGSSGVSSATFGTSRISQTYAIALIPASTTPGLAGTADVAFTATATGSGVGALIGSAGLALAATAVIAAAGALSGSANLSLAATGTVAGAGALAGNASLAFTASGTLANSSNLRGAATLAFTATATPQARAAIVGTAPLAFTAAANPTAAGKLAGSAGLTLSATGTPTADGVLAGNADLSFMASATPEIDYTPDGRYYVALPVRPFYASLPPRSFYAQLPARSFYILSDPNMTPTFEDKDPREDVVVTLDASSNLAPGETLTGTPVVQVAVVKGTDSGAQSIAGMPVINTQPVSIKLRNGSTVTVPANQGVQIPIVGGLDACEYLIAAMCTTSNPAKKLTPKGILPVTAY